ncbi:MAG: hypothetical protein M0Z58_03175 [Nitrospiraceae bacterium]|nr:hypothetical protein [Nitrospiraceae bacterium]
MADLVRILVILVLFVVLVRKKVQAGLVLLLGSFLLALLYLMPARLVLLDLEEALVKNPETLKIVLALTAIRGFELVLREKEVLERMMSAARGFLKGKRALIVSMPLLIGTIPSMEARISPPRWWKRPPGAWGCRPSSADF